MTGRKNRSTQKEGSGKSMILEIKTEMIQRMRPSFYSIPGYPIIVEYSDIFVTLTGPLHLIKYFFLFLLHFVVVR